MRGVAAGASHSLAWTARGQLLVWGSAAQAKLGFAEGALSMPTETITIPAEPGADEEGDEYESYLEAYQPLPRQLWLAEPMAEPTGGPGEEVLQQL